MLVSTTGVPLILDVEGSDGKHREDDVCFEKQSALFALAVSDIVLINMWCHDIGREQAGNRPLLKTVFQVIMRLFQPRRTTLLFVIRDKSKTPLDKLESALKTDIQKIYDDVIKPYAHEKTALTDFFNVEVTSLSSYESNEEEFKKEVVTLKQRYIDCIASDAYSRDRRDKFPASAFLTSAQEIWKNVKENKDLNFASHKMLVATLCCEDVCNKSHAHLVGNEEWRPLKVAAEAGSFKEFGKMIMLIISTCLSKYDAETVYFDEGIRTDKLKLLEDKVEQLVTPIYRNILDQLHSLSVANFKKEFEEDLAHGEKFLVAAHKCSKNVMSAFREGCIDAGIENSNYDSSQVLDKLQHNMDAHVAFVSASRVDEIISWNEEKLYMALSTPVKDLLNEAGDKTWPAIRNLYQEQTNSAVSRIDGEISGFNIDQKTTDQKLSDIEHYARSVVEKEATEASKEVLSRMKGRFSELFSYDSNSMRRTWKDKKDMKNIEAITKTAFSASLRVLSVMAAIQLDDYSDSIAVALSSAFRDSSNGVTFPTNSLTSSTWEKVPSTKTFITPAECKALWTQFMKSIEITSTIGLATNIIAIEKIKADEAVVGALMIVVKVVLLLVAL